MVEQLLVLVILAVYVSAILPRSGKANVLSDNLQSIATATVVSSTEVEQSGVRNDRPIGKWSSSGSKAGSFPRGPSGESFQVNPLLFENEFHEAVKLNGMPSMAVELVKSAWIQPVSGIQHIFCLQEQVLVLLTKHTFGTKSAYLSTQDSFTICKDSHSSFIETSLSAYAAGSERNIANPDVQASIPLAFDFFKANSHNCGEMLESSITNQFSNPTCYIHATLSAASMILCQRTGRSEQFSMEEVISCGHSKPGKRNFEWLSIPVEHGLHGGGHPMLIAGYATDYGLLQRHNFGDIVANTFGPCIATNDNGHPSFLGCRGLDISHTIEAHSSEHVSDEFCDCPVNRREGYDVFRKSSVVRVRYSSTDCVVVTTEQDGSFNLQSLPGSSVITNLPVSFCTELEESSLTKTFDFETQKFSVDSSSVDANGVATNIKEFYRAGIASISQIPDCARDVDSGESLLGPSIKFYNPEVHSDAGIQEVQRLLLAHGAVVISLPIYNDFYSYFLNNKDRIYRQRRTLITKAQLTSSFLNRNRELLTLKQECLSRHSDKAFYIGEHSMVIYGWDFSDPYDPYWLVQNSYGATFADNGRFRLSTSVRLPEVVSIHAVPDPKCVTKLRGVTISEISNFHDLPASHCVVESTGDTITDTYVSYRRSDTPYTTSRLKDVGDVVTLPARFTRHILPRAYDCCFLLHSTHEESY